MKLFAVEGNRLWLDGGAMFGNVPKNLWSNWILFDTQNRVSLASRCLLIQTDSGQNILFEAGTGSFFEPKLKERYGITEPENRLLENLISLGLKESDIDAIVLSHLHFDHAGGLLSAYEEGKEPRLLFPNAKYYVNKLHWENAQNPHPRERASFIPHLHQMLQKSNRLILIEEPPKDLNLDITFYYSHGHTKGLMLSEIWLETGPLIFASDLVPGLPWIHLPVAMGYDRYPELLIDEKKILFTKIIGKKGKLFFTHDPKVSCVFLKQDESGKFYGDIDRMSELNSGKIEHVNE